MYKSKQCITCTVNLPTDIYRYFWITLIFLWNEFSLTLQLYKSIKIKSGINIPLEYIYRYTLKVCNWAHSACNASGISYYNKLSISSDWMYFLLPPPPPQKPCPIQLWHSQSPDVLIDWKAVHPKPYTAQILFTQSPDQYYWNVPFISYYITPELHSHAKKPLLTKENWSSHRSDSQSLNITATNVHTYTRKTEWLELESLTG